MLPTWGLTLTQAPWWTLANEDDEWLEIMHRRKQKPNAAY
jgi:hypothetical protein